MGMEGDVRRTAMGSERAVPFDPDDDDDDDDIACDSCMLVSLELCKRKNEKQNATEKKSFFFQACKRFK
jgi:hypothetical protein